MRASPRSMKRATGPGHGYEQTHESPHKSAHAKRRKTSLGSTRRTTKAESTPTEKISSRDTPDGPPENDGWSAEKRRTTKAESSTNQTSWLTTRRTVRQWTPDGPSNDGRQGHSTAQTKTDYDSIFNSDRTTTFIMTRSTN